MVERPMSGIITINAMTMDRAQAPETQDGVGTQPVSHWLRLPPVGPGQDRDVQWTTGIHDAFLF